LAPSVFPVSAPTETDPSFGEAGKGNIVLASLTVFNANLGKAGNPGRDGSAAGAQRPHGRGG
jgi:hypothetical protein